MSVTFSISGTAMTVIEGSDIYSSPVNYDGGSKGACDAYAALREARPHRRGRGVSYKVTTTAEGAETLRDYCETVGTSYLQSGGPEERAEGRELLAAEKRIAALLTR